MIKMGRKTKEEKEFLIVQRKKTGASLTAAPVWIMQKKGERVYNTHARRHWRETSFGQLYRKKTKKTKIKSGHKKKSARLLPKKTRTTRDAK